MSPPDGTEKKTLNQHHYISAHTPQSKVNEPGDLGVLSFDVCEGSLGQLHQLCVSHSVDSGGSWLFG